MDHDDDAHAHDPTGDPTDDPTDDRTDDAARHRLVLLTRAGCHSCTAALAELRVVATEAGLTVGVRDVDTAAEHGEPGWRAEFGDRVPVVLLDGVEHSYWEVDAPRLRADLGLPPR